ncbi:MAG: hypothetical protein D5R96_00715 [Methanocalculus sp. MSAO_Arc2]|uniref:DUF7544 domain-containing protein n=1 Tax=Methanocalculus sp. MSAO_Arc2 TaxID=2293855 RepID=UPI000FF0349D|nr:MAG: hypothetical protein D5R96_00715 [Methanocalculus sp. MSAO_Arc2]
MAEYYAFAELDRAIQSTKDLLWPFQAGIWIRLAIISFFLGWGGGFPQPTWSSDGDFYGEVFSGLQAPAFPDNVGLILAVILGIGILALAYILIGSILQFVFVDCIATKNVSLSQTFRPRMGKGFRLFLFQIGITILFLLLIAAVFLPFILASGGLTGFPNVFPRASLLLVMIPLFLIFAVIIALIQLITIDFVVPVMIKKDCGVIEGWRSIVAAISNDVMQTVIYVIVRFLAALGAGIVMIILTLLLLAIIAIPFVLVGFFIYTFAVLSTIFLIILLGIPYLIIAISAALMVSVPFITFFRTYSLMVLGRLSPENALLS